MNLRVLILVLSLSSFGACAGETGSEPEASGDGAAVVPAGTREDPYVGHGFIQEVREGELLIRHETIVGFMPAMTMAYPLSRDVVVDDLATGDEIMFDVERLEPNRHQVIRVEIVGP